MSKGHTNQKLKNLPWSWCNKCGLVFLKNEATRKAMKASCEGDKN